MPRIRKKTSNRQNTRDRAKITGKVREHNKKSKRDAKKNPTWKSKKKADPGVPSSFHLKDQVLAELANEKRVATEQREARRLAQKAAARGGAVEDDEDDDKDVPGITSVASNVVGRAAQAGTSSLPVEPAAPVDVPDLIDTDLPTLQAALDRADILFEIVDARDVHGGRSKQVEDLVLESGAKVVLVINKIALQAWLGSSPLPTFLVSSTTALGVPQLRAYLADALEAKADLTVALLGLPNVGKSALLNALSGSSAHKVSVPGSSAAAKQPQPTTSAPIEVELKVAGGVVRVIDTPGWEFVEDDDEDGAEDDDDEEMASDEDEGKWDLLEARVAGDMLRRNLGRIDRVKDVFPLVNHIVTRSNSTDLMLVYNVPYFESGNVEAFLTGLARANARIKKHGEPDLEGAARIVLRDWAHHTFPYYSLPPAAAASAAHAGQPDMAAVLAASKGKKEMKAAGRGLVRFNGGDVDVREVFLDDDYTEVHAPEKDDEDDDDEEGDEGVEDDDDEDDEPELLDPADGEELDLASGSEPSSPSSLASHELASDDDESAAEPEPAIAPSKLKRKARLSSPAQRKKAKTVVFAKAHTGKTGGTADNDARPVRGILKRQARAAAGAEQDGDEDEVADAAREVGKKRKRESVGGGRKVLRTEEPSQPVAPAPKAKAAAPATTARAADAPMDVAAVKAKPAKAAKGKRAESVGEGEAYDFSKHF